MAWMTFRALKAFLPPLLKRTVPAAMRSWLATRAKSRKLQRVRNSRGVTHGNSAETPRSFGDLIDNRREWLYSNLPLASAEYHYNLHSKQQQKRLAQQLGLALAQEYLSNVPLAEAIRFIEQSNLERFVIKPNASRSSAGCRCVVRDGDGYLDLRTGQSYRSSKQLGDDVSQEYRKLKRPDEWIIEELLLPVDGSLSLIEDYKFYCFAGVVELILHKKLIAGEKKQRVLWYTRDWKPVDVGKYKDRIHHTVEVPHNSRQLVETAEEASSKTCYPFVRVDLYDTSRGIVFGEFTPGPGGRHDFSPEWSERLSKRWFEAAGTLEDGLHSGRIQPLYPEVAGVSNVYRQS
jgi:hypothetical protein